MNLKKNIRFFLLLYLVFLNQSYIKPSSLIHVPFKKEMEKIIASLCLKFQVTNQLDIKFVPEDHMGNAIMAYYGNTYTITVADTIEKRFPLSYVYMILLHEFRHVIQDKHGMFEMRTGKKKLKKFYNPYVLKESVNRKNAVWFPNDSFSILLCDYMPINKEEENYVKRVKRLHRRISYDKIFKPFELDADLFSIKKVSCPVCYDIALYCSLDDEISEEGYAGLDLRKKYRAKKQHNACCKAHKCKNTIQHANALKGLYSLLKSIDHSQSYEDLSYMPELCYLDKKCGPLSDRYTMF